MDNLLTNLQPISKEHSIKEAVLTVFLASKIMKPKDYGQLINSDLKSEFQQFEALSQTQIKLEQQNVTIQQQEDAGFKFVGFNNGKPAKILRGMNEENRYFFSFHCFDYGQWSSFKQKFLEFVRILDKFQPGCFVQAYSLLYIDEFNWIDTKGYSSEFIFNKHSEFLPKDFFNSKNVVYNINMEKEIDGNKCSDRLDVIVTDKLVNKNIIVSHNQTFELSEINKITALIGEQSFAAVLNKAHIRNKDLLKDVLIADVCKLIKID